MTNWNPDDDLIPWPPPDSGGRPRKKRGEDEGGGGGPPPPPGEDEDEDEDEDEEGKKPKQGEEEGEEPHPGEGDLPMETADDHGQWSKHPVPDEIGNVIIKETVSSAVSETKQRGKWGDVPGGVQFLIDKLLTPSVNWRQALRGWIGNRIKVSTKPTSKRENRRFPFPAKGKRTVRGAHIWVAIDTSASVTFKEKEQFLTEIARIVGKAEITIIPWDTDIRGAIKIRNKPQLLHLAKSGELMRGGGGTDIFPLFHALRHKSKLHESIQRTLRSNPNGIIILTDGEFRYPPEGANIGIPVLWGVTQTTRENTSGTAAANEFLQKIAKQIKFGKILPITVDNI